MKNSKTDPFHHPAQARCPISRTFWLGAAAVALSTASSLAVNLAPNGTPLIGVNDAIDGDNGTAHANAGTAANVNDLNPDSRVDTYRPNDASGMSYVGVRWPFTRYEPIESLTLTLATFFDGGWFGPNNASPGNGGALAAEHLAEPTVQVTTDGETWTTVPHTSDYMTAMTGFTIGTLGGTNPTKPVAVFTLTEPPTEIRGIRIIGPNGGPADGNGFLGVFELEVEGGAFTDSDSDGMADAWETDNGLQVGSNDAADDADGDGLSNGDEFVNGTNAQEDDTDADGITDQDELFAYGTNPRVADTDGDGLDDGDEVTTHLTNATLADSDGDGLSDGAEVNTHETDPNNMDSDNDSYLDGFEVAQGTDPNDANSIPNNQSLVGAGYLGVKESLDAASAEVELYHSGNAAAIVDDNPATRVDTFNGGTPTEAYTAGFIGVLWLSTPPAAPIEKLELTLATFGDGGWFGPNGVGPGAGQPLTAAHLAEPRVEISTDGFTWTTVPHTSDYISVMTGHRIGGGGGPNPSMVTSVFTLAEPADGIAGIRLVGPEGGQASGGFLGVADLAALSSSSDVDDDGMDDSWERENGLVVGTDDADEDADEDGLTNLEEFNERTNPQVADTDGDGLNDGAELDTHNTNPLQADTDADTLSDGAEINTHETNPNSSDTDGDGFRDGIEVSQGSDPNDAESFPANLALSATAILGLSESIEAGPDTAYEHVGTTANINDANLATRVDTWNNAGTQPLSYVGLLWDEPLSEPIESLTLTHAIFGDGGWFGVNGVGPSGGTALNADQHLIAPTVQVTTDGGTTWQTVEATSDYLTAVAGIVPGGVQSATATFELAEPQSNINGIRLIGTEGGTASGGFIGVFELEVNKEQGGGTGVELASPAIAGDEFTFTFESVAGETHHVEWKNSLSDETWQSLTTITGDGTTKTVTDEATGEMRFYRVRSE